MDDFKMNLLALFAAINLCVTNYFGIFTPLLYVVVLLMIADLFTRGYAAGARKDENIQSKLVFKGLYRKLGMCMLIVLALILDFGLLQLAESLGIIVSTKIIFTALTLAWIFVREFISNLENLSHAGMDLPPFITKALTVAKDKVDNLGDTIVGGGKNE